MITCIVFTSLLLNNMAEESAEETKYGCMGIDGHYNVQDEDSMLTDHR